MKNLRYIAVLIGMAMISMSQVANAQVQTARYISITSNTHGFYEYLPEGYSTTNPQKYAMILFVHGMGELGSGSTTDLPKVKNTALPKRLGSGTFPTSFTVNGQTHRFVVLSPQFVNWPTAEDLDAVIRYGIANYNVDPSRIYLTGLSMGGGAVWEYGGHETNTTYPNRIAAMSPICGASYPSKYRAAMISKTNLAVWAFHNDGDPTAPVFYTNDYVNFINTTVPPPTIPAKKTIFVSNSHDAWTKAYDPTYRENGMNMYEWFLTYSRGTVIPSNAPPVVNAGSNQTITLPTNSVQLSGSATDANGTIASYSWSRVSGPTQFSFSSTSSATPTVNNLVQGTYTFRLTAVDNQGAQSTDDVNVIVNASAPVPGTGKYVKVNIFGGSNSYVNAEWNNWNTSASLSSGNLFYNDGNASSISAALSQQSGISDNGTTLNYTMAPKEVVRYTSNSTSNRTLTLSGLDNTKKYDIEIYASRSGTSNNTSRFAIGTTSIDVLTDNNTANKVSFNAVSPTSGNIVVNISKLNSYNYINGFMITEVGTGGSTNTPPTANAGTDQTITLPNNSAQLTGVGSDAGGAVTYGWTKVAGPDTYSFNNTSISNPLANFLVQGTYTFRLTVTDNQGASTSDDVNVVVNGSSTPPPPSSAKFVKVNLFGGSNSYANSEWNNWNTTSSLSSGSLKYSDGVSSTVSATLSQQSGVSDNGTTLNFTMAPKEVVRYASYSTSNRTLTISGLDNSKTYNLELYASRSGTSNNTTRFTAGGINSDVLTDNNTANKASFTSLVPSGGQITVTITKLNAYTYINGFMLTENATGTTSAASATESTIEVSQATSSFDVFPNPVEDRFVLQVNNSNTGQMKVQIVDMSGAVQKEFALTKNSTGASQTYLSIGDLKAGEYIISVQIGTWTESKKISKL